MSTTALIIEYLVIGIQAILWLASIILLFFGSDWFNIEKIKGFETIGSFLILPILYAIGMFIDTVSDRILEAWTLSIKKKCLQDKSHSVIHLLLKSKDEWLSSYIDYNRGKLRVLRSSALNFLLISTSLPIATGLRLQGLLGNHTRFVVGFEVLLGAALTGLAIWSWKKITYTFYEHMKTAYDALLSSTETETSAPGEIKSFLFITRA